MGGTGGFLLCLFLKLFSFYLWVKGDLWEPWSQAANAPKVEKGMFSLPPSLPRLLKPSIKKEYDAIEASWGEGVGFFGPLLHS